jgi:AAA domain, putative AbiEii toxin, Type IV TA system
MAVSVSQKGVRIDLLQIRGFRSCLDTRFSPKRDLSVLVGVNGAGKTNILQSIVFLKRALTGDRFRRRGGGKKGQLSSARILAAFAVDGSVVRLKSKVSFGLDERGVETIHSVQTFWKFPGSNVEHAWLPDSDELSLGHRTIRWESLSPRYMPLDLRRRSRLSWIPTAGQRRHFRPVVLWSKEVQRSFLKSEKFRNSPEFRREQEKVLRLQERVERIKSFFRSLEYYSASQFTDPSACPSSFELDQDGDLVSSFSQKASHVRFMHDLYLSSKSEDNRYSAFINLVGPKGINLIHGIRWRHLRINAKSFSVAAGGKIEQGIRTRVIVVPSVETDLGLLSFSQLSEGTFRSLAIVFYLMSKECNILLVEEPEVCIHYKLLSDLVSAIKVESLRKQVICSTHSELLLDKLEPGSLFMVSRLGGAGTKVEALGKRMNSKARLALQEFLDGHGNLGEFWRSGGLD